MAETFFQHFDDSAGMEVVLTLPDLLLPEANEMLKSRKRVVLAAQDISPYPPGSYTGGTPASSASAASASADNGVSSAGLTTAVQPTARAGLTFRVIIAFGKFQGVTAATTPTGCFNTTMRASDLKLGIVSP